MAFDVLFLMDREEDGSGCGWVADLWIPWQMSQGRDSLLSRAMYA